METLDNQEIQKIFEFLWPQECWHKFIHTHDRTDDRSIQGEWRACRCGKIKTIFIDDNQPWPASSPNPDLSTPNGMVMILNRLVEMGYRKIDFSYGVTGVACFIRKLDGEEFMGVGEKESLAVLTACQQLMEKEEEK